MPQPDDAGGPSHPSHFLGCIVLASGTLTLSPTSIFVSTLYQLSGYTVTPTACKILCVRFVCLVHGNFTHSASDATLDTGDWLGLTGQGLAPCKEHQASLGALTSKLSCVFFFVSFCAILHKKKRRKICQLKRNVMWKV